MYLKYIVYTIILLYYRRLIRLTDAYAVYINVYVEHSSILSKHQFIIVTTRALQLPKLFTVSDTVMLMKYGAILLRL